MFVNNSRLYRFHRCRRRFFWNDIFNGTGLVQVVDGKRMEPFYLSIGKAVHAALARWYDPRFLPTESWLLEDYAAYATQVFYQESGLDPEATTEEEDEGADYPGKLVLAYLRRDVPIDDFSVLRVEDPFQAVLGEVCWSCGTPYTAEVPVDHQCPKCGATIFVLVGKPDVVIILPNGALNILDHKTVQSFSEDSVNAFGHSFQQIGYCYGYGKAHGIDITRFGINFLQKAKTVGEECSQLKRCPACNAGKKKMPTCETCNGTGKVERQNKLMPFRRSWFDITDDMFDRYMLSTLRKVRDIEEEAKLFLREPDASYPMEESACLGCKFFNLCWEGHPQKWWNPSNSQLDGFEPRQADYVDDLMSEEKV